MIGIGSLNPLAGFRKNASLKSAAATIMLSQLLLLGLPTPVASNEPEFDFYCSEYMRNPWIHVNHPDRGHVAIKRMPDEESCIGIARNLDEAIDSGDLQYIIIGRLDGDSSYVFCSSQSHPPNTIEVCNDEDAIAFVVEGFEPFEALVRFASMNSDRAAILLETPDERFVYSRNGSAIGIVVQRWLNEVGIERSCIWRC
jgi:hypothetical protein